MPLGDPSMGGHAGFSLGLALAQPDRPVVVFDTEGDLLMNLGILATIAEQGPRNFYYFLMDNECYATTGGQPVPNAQKVAYDAVARACGIERTYAFTDIEQVSKKLATIFANPGPVFVWIKCIPKSKIFRSVSASPGANARRPGHQRHQAGFGGFLKAIRGTTGSNDNCRARWGCLSGSPAFTADQFRLGSPPQKQQMWRLRR